MATTSRSAAARLVTLVVAVLLALGTQVFVALPRAVADDPVTGTITGTVLDAAGHPLAGATVTSSGTPAVTATTVAAGTYTLVVPVGSYTLTATLSGYAPKISPQLDVAAGATVDLTNFTLPKYATVTGTVSDGSGQGISPVDVKFYDATSSSLTPVTTTTTAINGTFQVPDLLPGSYKVEYDAARVLFMTRWYNLASTREQATIVPVADGASLDLSTTLISASTIKGTITDVGTGSPIAGASVVVYRNGAGIAGIQSGADGTYELKIAAADQYKVRASAVGHVTTWFGPSEHEASAQSIALLNSQVRNGIDIPLDTGGAISGTVGPDTLPYSWVTAVSQGDSYYAVVAADHTYTITDLPPGAFSVGFHANGYYPEAYPGTVPVVRHQTTPAINGTLTPFPSGGGGTGTCSLQGRATDLSGGGLPGVLVANGTLSTTTAADGSYDLTINAWTAVSFSLDGYVTESPQFSCSQPVMQAEVALSRAATITGTVTVNGIPQGGAHVTVTGVSSHFGSTTTGADGTYTFSNLPEDNYAVSATWISPANVTYPTQFFGGGLSLTQAWYLPAAEGSTLAGVDIDLGKSASVNGKVYLPGATPAMGAKVVVSGGDVTSEIITVQPDGAFSIGGLPAGTFTVTAYLSQWATKSITVTLTAGGTLNNQDITLGDGYTVSGVVSRGGANLAGSLVYLGRAGELDSVYADAGGHFVFRGVPAGQYTLGVETGNGTVFWYGATYERSHAASLTVSADTIRDLALPVASTVQVTVKNPDGTTLDTAMGFVTAKDHTGTYVTQASVASGVATLALWTGDFTVETALVGYPTATAAIVVDNTPTDDASIVQHPGSTLNVVLNDATGASGVSVIARHVASGVTATGGVPMDGLPSGDYKVAYYPLNTAGDVCGPLVWYGGTGFVSADTVELLDNGETVLFVDASCATVPTGYNLTVQLHIPSDVAVSPTDPISVSLSDESGQTGAWQPVDADATGKAVFTSVQPGTYVVDADGSLYGLLSDQVTVTVAAASTVDVPMILGGTVTGRVVDAFSHSVRAGVTLTGATTSYQRGTDTGVFTVGGIRAGDYSLTVTPAAPYTAVTLAHVPVVAGQVLDVGTITSALGGRITGHLPSLPSGYQVTIDALNAAGDVVATTQGVLGSDYAIWGVPAGAIRLRFSGDGLVTRWWNGSSTLAGATPITVVAGQVVAGISPDLDTIVVQTTTISGHVTGASGSLDDITVSATADGVSVASAGVSSDGSYTLTVPTDRTYTVTATQCIRVPLGSEFWMCVDTLSSDTRTIAAGLTAVTGIDLSFGGGLLAFTAPLPTIAGDAVVGATLTATVGTWAPTPDTTTITWSADGTAIPGATGTTLVLAPDQVGTQITVMVTGTKTGYAATSRTSAPTAAVAPVTVVAGQVTFSGTPVVGTPVTVDPGTWTPAGVTLAYAWTRDGIALLSATGSSYTPTADDLGRPLAVTVIGTKDGQTTSVSVSSEPVQPGTLTSGTVTVSGDATIGSTLSALTGASWGPAPVTFSYQWLRDGTPLAGATLDTYVVAAGDVNAALSVTATGTKAGYGDVPVTSSPVTVGLLTMPAAVVSVPSSATVGQTITPSVTGWPAGTTVVIHWLRNGTELTTGASYVVTPADSGTMLTVTATGTKVGYNDGLAYATLGTVQPGAITGTVAVTGTGTVGTTVTASASWTPNLVPATTYTWQRNGVTVSVGAGYVVQPLDAGQALTVVAAPTVPVPGYTTTPVTATVAVTPGTIVGSLSLSGGTGVGGVLVPSGSWTPSTATATYSWLRDGGPAGTGSTYTVSVGDAGHTISVRAVVSATGYEPATLTSNTVSIPLVAGTVSLPTATVGQPVAPTLSGWGDEPTSLLWSIDGRTDTGATYTPLSTDSGKTLTLTVTAAKTGFASVDASGRTVVQDATMASGTVAFAAAPTVDVATAATLLGWEPGSTFAYRWTVDGTQVSTSSTYTPAPADAGKALLLTVTATKQGYGSASSSASATVLQGTVTGGAATITGTLAVGSPLTATSSGWTPAGATATYAWLRDGLPNGATGDTYVPTLSDVGHTLAVVATATAPGYGSATVTSAPTAQVPAVPMVPGQVTITGTAAVGSTLTASSTGWTPATATVTFQWLRNGVAIAGATTDAYVATLTDVGATISVRGTAAATGYVTTSVTSAPTAVVPPVALTPGTVTIAGTPAVGATLTADPGTWAPSGATFTYQWLRGGVAISGATAATYTVGLADVGARLSVTATGSLSGFTPTSSTSAETTVVPQPTVVAGTVTISGAAAVGATLTANPGTWSPADATFAYQWLRNGVAITGATAATYVPVAADLGQRLSVTVTGARTGYVSATATSAQTAVVSQQAVIAGTVTITGTPYVLSTLTANPGTWSPVGVRLSYQWLRDGVAIPGATGQTYSVPLSDLGRTLTVSVTGTRFGYVPATALSAPVGPIQQPRVVAGTVTITGTPMVTSTLTAHHGSWTPANVRLSYQWFRDGVAIAGETDQTYVLRNADTGHTVTVAVTGTRFGYAPATAVSAPTAPVQAAHVVAGTVTITGTATVDNRLTAHPGSWTPGNANLSYQWLRDGVAIAGATNTRYTVALADVGHAISVRVTGTRNGFTPATATSVPTAVVPAAQVLPGNVSIIGRAVQGSFLLAQTGGWSQNVSLSYQWLRDGIAVPAARRWYYQVTSQDVGHVLTVVVTGTQPGYLPTSVTSAPTGTVR